MPSQCATTCGNGAIDAACGEVCDGAELGSARCPADAPEGSPACAADCLSVDVSGCRPASPSEICGNCTDDDGDGLVDFEDPDCCGPLETRTAALRQAFIRPRSGGSVLRLRSQLDFEPSEVLPATQEVFLQLRTADAPGLFCARLQAGDFRPIRNGFRFRDRYGRVASALGVKRVKVWIDRDGHLRYRLTAKLARFVTPSPGPMRVTIGFLDRTLPGRTVAGTGLNRCAVTERTLRAGRGGAVRYP
jgi:hypothetical protein